MFSISFQRAVTKHAFMDLGAVPESRNSNILRNLCVAYLCVIARGRLEPTAVPLSKDPDCEARIFQNCRDLCRSILALRPLKPSISINYSIQHNHLIAKPLRLSWAGPIARCPLRCQLIARKDRAIKADIALITTKKTYKKRYWIDPWNDSKFYILYNTSINWIKKPIHTINYQKWLLLSKRSLTKPVVAKVPASAKPVLASVPPSVDATRVNVVANRIASFCS